MSDGRMTTGEASRLRRAFLDRDYAAFEAALVAVFAPAPSPDPSPWTKERPGDSASVALDKEKGERLGSPVS